MSHTVLQRQKLLARVRRIGGLVDAIERALESDASCDKILHLIAGMRGATTGLMAEVVEDHIRTHLVDVEAHPTALDADGTELLIEIVRTYLR